MHPPSPQRVSLWSLLSIVTGVSVFLGVCLFAFGPEAGRVVIRMVAGNVLVGGSIAVLVWVADRWIRKRDR